MNTFNIIMLIGWIFLLATWFPKESFITNEYIRTKINLVLSMISLGFFLAAGITQIGL
jgi:hypothetical protein